MGIIPGRRPSGRAGSLLRKATLTLALAFSAAPLAAGPAEVALELQPICSDLKQSMDDRLAILLTSGWEQLKNRDAALLVDQISWARAVEMRAGQTIAAGAEDETFSLVQTLTRHALVADPAGQQEYGVFLKHSSEAGLSLYLSKIEAHPVFQHYCSLIINPPEEARNRLVELFVLAPAIATEVGQVWRILSPVPNPDARVIYSRLLTIPKVEGAVPEAPAAILRYQLELQVSR